jgi:hypothetical protein
MTKGVGSDPGAFFMSGADAHDAIRPQALENQSPVIVLYPI